ncbi:Gfo/Idh/MocA family protein [Marinicrinis lubricantis]|uniref:Gfo/Idh/MocA family protein n=1 Tax=Marinicrinis lubricantis TaxID=2086470 RepID=A0ABW1IWM1_9BACL
MVKENIRWGIMGPGYISSTFAKDLQQTEGAELVAVGSKSMERAEKFAEEFNIPKAYGDYEEMANDPNIDIVYVGTLHPAHKDNVLTCLRAGKAVLCEKPFTINAQESKELISYARENQLFLMEAMWTRYLPPIVKVREWLQQGLIGEVKLVQANFGFDIGNQAEGRLLNRELGGGALLDAGIYPVSFASMVYGQQPSKIMSSAYLGETGVDERFSLLFEYEGGQKAMLGGAVRLDMVNDAYIYGEKGYIHVPNFLFSRAATLHVKGEEPVPFQCERETSGYNFEAIEAMSCLREGRTESSIMPLDETQQIMQTLDQIRAQWGLRYPGEE